MLLEVLLTLFLTHVGHVANVRKQPASLRSDLPTSPESVAHFTGIRSCLDSHRRDHTSCTDCAQDGEIFHLPSALSRECAGLRHNGRRVASSASRRHFHPDKSSVPAGGADCSMNSARRCRFASCRAPGRGVTFFQAQTELPQQLHSLQYSVVSRLLAATAAATPLKSYPAQPQTSQLSCLILRCDTLRLP